MRLTWYPMEPTPSDLNLFIRDYLTLIPNKGQVYDSFKRYMADKKQPEALEAVYYSKHYVRIALLWNQTENCALDLRDIHALSVEVVPFLLGEDYTQGRLVDPNFSVNESVCLPSCDFDIKTAGERTFADTDKIKIDNYLQSLKVAFWLMTGSQHFPSDNQFQREFLIKESIICAPRTQTGQRKIVLFD